MFWNRKRNYRATYEIEVKNNLDEENQIFLVAPLSPNTSQQELKSEIVFEPADCQVKTDWVFGNQYVVWQLNLKAGETVQCRFSFEIAVSPFRVKISKNFQLVDYGQTIEAGRTLSFVKKFIQFDNEKIRTLAKEIIGQEKNLKKILNLLNNFVVSRLNYGQPIEGLYSALQAWENKTTDCGGFSALLIALCLALGIPARLAVGFWAVPPTSALGGLRRARYNKNEMHVWVEIMLPNGQWLPADPAVESLRKQQRTKKVGQLGFVGSDRIAFSYGCNILLEIKGQEKRADILQNPLVFPQNGPDSCSIKMQLKTISAPDLLKAGTDLS